MPPARLQSLLLTFAAVVMAAVCLYGGARLTAQGAVGWGVALAAVGIWTLYKAVTAYRTATAERPGRDAARPSRERRRR